MEFVFLPLNRKGGYSAFPPSLELNGAKGQGEEKGEGRGQRLPCAGLGQGR